MVNIEASTQLELLDAPSDPVTRAGKKRKKKSEFPPLEICSNNSFVNFLEGSSNQAAIKIAKRIIEKPGEDFPLVFFQGMAGLGKTHLLHAIYKELLGIKNIYLGTAKAFLDYFQIKCKNHGFAKFLTDFVANVDVLLLDDIEDAFISEDFQNDFCHIYNHFNIRGKQIVLSGHLTPKDLTGVFPKFHSRLNGGLVQEIGLMDEDLILKYVNQSAREENISLDEKSLAFILKNSGSDGRSIRSSLLKLKAQKITRMPEKTFPSEIVESVGREFKILTKNIYSNSRKKQYILARHISMYLMNKGLGFSFFKIGQIFERDHTTILYAVAKVEEKIKEDSSFGAQLIKACERVKSKKLPWPVPANCN